MTTLPTASPALPDLPLRPVKEWGLKELERVRLILRGGSVIEWRKLHFKTHDEVDRFLRLCQIDPSRSWDEEWARTILADSVEYLRKTFDYRVAEPVANPERIHDLFQLIKGAIGNRNHSPGPVHFSALSRHGLTIAQNSTQCISIILDSTGQVSNSENRGAYDFKATDRRRVCC